jgi:dihydrofolate synthase / folylpolyglutamate synthase
MLGMVLRNFAEARAALTGFYNRPGSNTYTLERMRALMEFLGNPQNSLRIVHVAGTSGKTSTAYYASALLEASGANVGLTVSPHVVEVNERVQINRAPLPEHEFCSSLGEFIGRIEASGIEPSYFELMVAFAFQQFATRGVDYAVIEVGLGGLLDATNVISRADKVCVITDIGLDHTNVLGNTISEIAAQKAGIIQHGNQVFMYKQSEAVMGEARRAALRNTAKLHEIARAKIAALTHLPRFQQRNFYLAEQAIRYVLQRDGVPELTPRQLKFAAGIQVPGRMEIHRAGGKTIIFDGAHNEQKMTALTQSIRAAFPDQPVAALAAFVKSDAERWHPALDSLALVAKHIIVSSFNLEPDDRLKKSMSAQQVADYLRESGFTAVNVESDLATACHELLKRPEPVLLITGSLYMLHDAREIVLGKN